MRLETFRGPDLSSLFRQARAELGDEVLIVNTRVLDGVRRREYEIVTTLPRDVARLRARMRAYPLPSVEQHRASRRPPFVVAVTGPSATDCAEALGMLVSDIDAFAEWTVGVLAPAAEPGRTLQQLAGAEALRDVPVELVARSGDMRASVERLSACDAILVYAPASGVPQSSATRLAVEALELLGPDEVHLVLSSGSAPDEAARMLSRCSGLQPTHLLITGAAGREAGAADSHGPGRARDFEDELSLLVASVSLPVRWIVQHSAARVELKPAATRILGASYYERAPLGAGASSW